MSQVRRSHALIILAVGICMLPMLAQAAATTLPDPPGGLVLTPVISQMGVYETNPLLLISGARTLYGSTTTPEMIISDTTPTKQLNLDTQVSENLFNLSEFDSTDLHEKGSFSTKNLVWNAGLQGAVDYDTTRSSELSNYGLRTNPVRHLDFSATPTVSYNPRPDDKLGLTASALKSVYANNIFTNYQTYSVTPSYTHSFNELNAGVVQFDAERYEATRGTRNSNTTLGPSVGWITTFTPQLKANANAGIDFIKQSSSGLAPQPWTTAFIFSTDLSYKTIQDRLDVLGQRSQYPFGNGTEALLTDLSITDVHSINEKISFNVGASYEIATYQSNGAGNISSLLGGTGGLTYHITDHFDLTGTYQYRHEALVGVDQKINDHSINFGVVYHPQAWSL